MYSYDYRLAPGCTRLVLVRHGETYQNAIAHLGMGLPGNDENAIVPPHAEELDLNPRGQRQAEALCQELCQFHFDACYSSTLPRVRQTISAWIKQNSHHEVTFRDDLQEMRFDFDALGNDVDKRHPDHFKNFLRLLGEAYDKFRATGGDEENFRIGKGETTRECRERIISAISEIVARHQGQSVLIAGHGMSNNIALGHLQRVAKGSGLIEQHNCCLNVVHWDAGQEVPACMFNSLAHLTADLITTKQDEDYRLGFRQARRALAILRSANGVCSDDVSQLRREAAELFGADPATNSITAHNLCANLTSPEMRDGFIDGLDPAAARKN